MKNDARALAWLSLWLGLVAALLAVVLHTFRLSADLRLFLPRPATTEQALVPYRNAFVKVRESCAGSVEDLVSNIQSIAFRASNGSGTHVTNLDALHAVGRYLETEPQEGDDCRGVFARGGRLPRFTSSSSWFLRRRM